MMGPTMTFVGSGGNIYQAGFTYTANKVVEEETGMSTTEHVSNLVNKDHNKKKKREKKLIKLVKSNYEKTRSNLLRNLVKKNYEKTRKIITTQSND